MPTDILFSFKHILRLLKKCDKCNKGRIKKNYNLPWKKMDIPTTSADLCGLVNHLGRISSNLGFSVSRTHVFRTCHQSFRKRKFISTLNTGSAMRVAMYNWRLSMNITHSQKCLCPYHSSS